MYRNVFITSLNRGHIKIDIKKTILTKKNIPKYIKL